jgi:hypothetical protein
VKNVKPGLGKLEDRSTPMVFLGYEEGSKAYQLYDLAGGKVVVSQDIVFDEAAAWSWKEPATGEARGVSDIFTVERLVIHGGGDAGVELVAGEPGLPAAEEAEPASQPGRVWRRWAISTNDGAISSLAIPCSCVPCSG